MIFASTSSRVIRSLCSRWIGDVAMNVWMRPCFAGEIASAALSMSGLCARARLQIVGGSGTGRPSTPVTPTASAIVLTARKSSGEAAAKPASMMSTPSRDRVFATSSFSDEVIVAPGDCSPSRRVVSKIRT